MFPAVVLLTLLVKPAAIARFVVPVCVNPVQRQTGRRLAHVGEKTRKLPPPLTHQNATPAIDRIFGSVGISAALDHIRPNDMRLTSAPSNPVPVSHRSLTHNIRMETSA